MKDKFIGKKFNRLLVLQKDQAPQRYVCQCECGNIISVHYTNLSNGRQKSCGCLRLKKTIQRNTTHNQRYTRLYAIWKAMKQRCLNPNSKSYSNYGKRGIKICEEWLNNYQSFYTWSINNGYKEDLTIDRINNDGNYEPSNCRWVDRLTQCNNTRQNKLYEINGVNKTIHQWALEYNVPVQRVRQRVYVHKWDILKALTTPVKIGRPSK